MAPRNQIQSRAEAAMLGLAIGDAMGWPLEDRGGRVGGTAKLQPRLGFMGWRRREGGRYAPHELDVQPGEYSDDTQLALAVARSRSVGERWWEHFTQAELPLWPTYERGGGGALKRAAQSWLNGRAPWEGKHDAIQRYFAAGGNGAVMRCMPHCFRDHGDDDALNHALDLDAIATHGHPRALLGSRLFGAAIAWALRRDEPLAYGELVNRLLNRAPIWSAEPELPHEFFAPVSERDWRESWRQAAEETVDLLHITQDGLAQGAVAIDRPILERLGAFSDAKGAGHVTAAAAVFLASRYASQPQQALLAAAFARGADTDTLAGLAAALLGALNGSDWLSPLAADVQDADYMTQLTGQVLAGEPASRAERPWRRSARTMLYRWLDGATEGATTHLGPFGDSTVIAIQDFDTPTLYARSWKMRTVVGQTLYLKRTEKARGNSPKWRPIGRSAQPRSESRPRAGLVLRVADLAESRRFYEQLIQLEVQRTTDNYVSFGWLALERAKDEPSSQLEIMPEAALGQLIRVYVDDSALPRLEEAVGALGLQIGTVDSRRRGFRCLDHDGHTVEFLVRNGASPTS